MPDRMSGEPADSAPETTAQGIAEPGTTRRATAERRESRLLVAADPRVAEALLVGEVVDAARERQAALRAGPARGGERGVIARPLRVVVSSRSLREHVAAALIRRAGRSLLGVAVQTHVALALEALERAGLPAPRGAALVPVLVRRHAAREPMLASWLADLDDGFGVVAAAVRDLLDAGFDGSNAEALGDAIGARVAAGELGRAAAGRAAAVARVALRTLADLEALGLGHRTTLLVRAREALQAAESPHALLPTARLWVHGFADATGLVSDWLEAVVRAFGARVIVETPVDPADPRRREERYSEAFRARMRGATGCEAEAPAPSGTGAVGACAPGSAIELLRAPGSLAEVRAVAARVRKLLDDGAEPESIGIVTRRLEPYRAALDAQLGRLGIPFSVIGAAAGPDAATRRAAALARLLELGEDTPVDTWLDADGRAEAADPDLRVALHTLGAGRLRAAARLDLDAALRDRSWLPLPVRRGGSLDEESEDVSPAVEGSGAEDAEVDAEPAGAEAARRRTGSRGPRRRTIARWRLEQARERAAAVLEALGRWPERASFADHRAAADALVCGPLAWRAESPGCAAGLVALAEADREVPRDLLLEREETSLLLARVLDEVGEARLGGAGAGVPVLTVTAARGRTFEHLFVLGLNRDGFASAPTDDPVLPDALRSSLREVLPEMPVRARARDEERHLFASLCAAAPRVLLAWQHVSDEGRTRAQSHFVARLRVARPELPETTAQPIFGSEGAGAVAGPRPAFEHAVRVGLDGPRRSWEPVRALALGEVRETLRAGRAVGAGSVDPKRLAAAHVAVLAELDGRPSRRDGSPPPLGPWFGRVGARRPSPPAGRPERFVTELEGVARCPWQAFLTRDLGLEPVPDALEALPAPTPLLRGNVVHRVLERIVTAHLPEPRRRLDEALRLGPVPVPWPDEAALDALLAAAAREVAVAEGISAPGFATALAQRVRPLLEAARAADWPPGAPPLVLGAELEADLTLLDAEGAPRRIGFRADRADLGSDGVFALTDYKSGKALSVVQKAELRRRDLLAAVSDGRALQVPAYQLAAHQLAPELPARSRYLYLSEKAPEHARELAAGGYADGEDLVRTFESTVRTLLDALALGAAVPRLDLPEQDAPCRFCDVASACLRGESGAQRRLAAWAEWADGRVDPAGPDTGLDATDRALHAVLRLRRPRSEDPSEEGGT